MTLPSACCAVFINLPSSNLLVIRAFCRTKTLSKAFSKVSRGNGLPAWHPTKSKGNTFLISIVGNIFNPSL